MARGEVNVVNEKSLADYDFAPFRYKPNYRHKFVNGRAIIYVKGQKHPLARDAIAHPIALYEVIARPGFEHRRYNLRDLGPHAQLSSGLFHLMAGIGMNLVATDDAAIAYRDELLNADLKIYNGWLPIVTGPRD